MQRFKYRYLLTSLLGLLLFWLVYHFTGNELKYDRSDTFAHLYIILPKLNGAYSYSGYVSVPHFLWHITVIGFSALLRLPAESAAIYATCFYALLGYAISVWVFEKIESHYRLNPGFLPPAVMAFLFSIVQPLSAPFFDSVSQYLGQYSPNAIHSPTYMCLRPFSILCFCGAYDLIKKAEDSSHPGIFFRLENGTRRTTLCLTISLLLSCIAKPTFAEMFIPTVALYMLFHWIYCLIHEREEAGTYFRKCLQMLLISLPALCYIGMQFTVYFLMGGSLGSNPEEGTVVLTKPFRVWHLYSDNVIFSVFLAMSFPLFMLLINRRFFLKETLGRLALLGYLVSFLEATFLGEAGIKIADANFFWPMMSGMMFFWLVSLIRLRILSETECNTKTKQILLQIAWFLLIAYSLSGIHYAWTA